MENDTSYGLSFLCYRRVAGSQCERVKSNRWLLGEQLCSLQCSTWHAGKRDNH